jgi:putative drug exporter of the RND superfamily
MTNQPLVAEPTEKDGLLVRLSRFSFRRRKLMVFGIWLPIFLVFNTVSGFMGVNYHTSFTLPNSDTQFVQDALVKTGDNEDAGNTALIVFASSDFADDSTRLRIKQLMEPFLNEVDKLDGVKVVSPYSEEGKDFNNHLGGTSFAEISYTSRSESGTLSLAKHIRQLGDTMVPIDARTFRCDPNRSHVTCVLRVEYGGQLFAGFRLPASELLGLLAAIVILLIAFGSVLAMGLPIGTALFGLGVGAAVMAIASNGFEIPEFGPEVAAMIGLGVGIDYALFIVTRYREQLHSGMEPEDAVIRAVDSSGRAVIFAGITVIVSLLGLFIVGLSFVRGLAAASAISVLFMMLASITLLPALIGFAGQRIDQTSRAAALAVGAFVLVSLVGVYTDAPLGIALLAAVAVAGVVMVFGALPFGKKLRVHLPHRQVKPRQQHYSYRWSRFIQRRPWPPLLAGVLVMVALAAPLTSMRLGFGDTGNLRKDNTARKAYDLIANGFVPGATGPLVLVSTDPAMNAQSAKRVDAALRDDFDIAFSTTGKVLTGGATWSWEVFPLSSPQDVATTDLVNRLRRTELPATGLDVKVGGFTAAGVDFAAYLSKRLPLLIAAVLILSFLLLMLVFRSILVPIKAVIMNMLSVGASYGVIVAIFQWGWLKGFFQIGRPGPVEAWAPMMLFAITFGLSMDYEVFLLSRMKEEFDRTGDNAAAVADGVAVTARVITAAALIMVCIFSAFVFGDSRELKVFGLGMAAAVLVDATVVRMVLVPATMELLGDRNWWMPKWLDRRLPHIHVEGHQEPIAPEPEPDSVLV